MTSPTQGQFIWCELMTTDMDKASTFYSDVVGWTTKTMPLPGKEEGVMYGVFDTRSGDADCGVAGFMNIPPDMEGQVPPNWCGYVYVDDVDAMVARFVSEGGSVRKPAQDVPGVVRFAVLADPHGAVLCIMKPLSEDNASPVPAPGTPGTFGWYELMAGNGEEALAFYGKVFGWTLDRTFDMGAMGKYLIFAHNGQEIGGMMTRPPQVPMPYWGYYITVPSIGAAIERIKAGGGTLIFGPQEVPGGSIIAQAKDPQGAYFALVGKA